MGKRIIAAVVILFALYQISMIVMVSYTITEIYMRFRAERVNSIIDELIEAYKIEYHAALDNSGPKADAIVYKYNELIRDKQHYYILSGYIRSIKDRYTLLFSIFSIIVLLVITAIIAFFVIFNTKLIDRIFNSLSTDSTGNELTPIKTNGLIFFKNEAFLYNNVIHELTRSRLNRQAQSAFINRTGSGLYFLHEIKNMLSPLSLRVDTVLHYSKLEDDTYNDIVGISNALNVGVSKLKSYKALFNLQKPIYEDVNLLDLIQTIVSNIDNSKIVRVSGMDNSIFTDRFYLETILVNIIKNSIEAACISNNSSPVVNIYYSGDLITISNNGEMIRPDILDRVFDAGFTTKVDGEGIGLFLVKELCCILNIDVGIVSNSTETVYRISL